MRIHAIVVRTVFLAGLTGQLCAATASAQTPGKASAHENVPQLTKEGLFEGTQLSAESQNKVLGNLLKHLQTPKWKGEGSQDMKVPVTPAANVFSTTMQKIIDPDWPSHVVPDPCASVADDAQLGAMHRLLETTLSSRSLNPAEFSAKAPKGCNGQRLRYYLNVTAQLFPEGGKK